MLPYRGKGIKAIVTAAAAAAAQHQEVSAYSCSYLWIQWSAALKNFNGHLETEHQLVLLKQTQACVAVHIIGQSINDGPQTAFKGVLFLAGSKCL